VLHIAFQFIPGMLASHDWRLRHAGLMAIAALGEGGAKVSSGFMYRWRGFIVFVCIVSRTCVCVLALSHFIGPVISGIYLLSGWLTECFDWILTCAGVVGDAKRAREDRYVRRSRLASLEVN
jgi:hypothetical protein